MRELFDTVSARNIIAFMKCISPYCSTPFQALIWILW